MCGYIFRYSCLVSGAVQSESPVRELWLEKPFLLWVYGLGSRLYRYRPPVHSTQAPVIYADSGQARNRIMPAASFAVPGLPWTSMSDESLHFLNARGIPARISWPPDMNVSPDSSGGRVMRVSIHP